MKRPAPIEIQSNGGLPIRCFTNETLLPDQAAQKQLRLIATLPGLRHHITVLPDVHYKHRNPSPTGSVVVSPDRLFPRVIDGGVNCGIRVMSFPMPVHELTPERLDDIYGRLMEKIPVKRRETPLITSEQCEAVLLHGLAKLVEYLGIPAQELDRVENRGRMLAHLDADTIRDTLGAEYLHHAIRKGLKTLCSLGAGNHFLELQEIVEVLAPDVAARLGLEKGHAVFMLHTDSRRLGKKILHPIIDEAREKFRNGAPEELWSVPAESEMGHRLLCALAAASHSGYANRAAITHMIRAATREVLGETAPPVLLLFDCGHETIQREKYHGETVWVHRHGASPALPPERFGDDPVLGKVGQPIPIPGSMGSHSYLAVGRAGAHASFYSVAHGAGRVMEKDEAKTVYQEGAVEGEIQRQGVRLYRYHVDNIAGQAPASFKNSHEVVNIMAAMDLIQPVVKLRPVAVLKG